MTIVNQDKRDKEVQGPVPEPVVGAGQPGGGARGAGGPLIGAALALLFLVGVALALALVPPASPSLGQQADAQAPLSRVTTTPGAYAPRPPITPFIAGTTASAITLAWRAPRPLPVGYRIYRATGRNAPYAIIGTISDPATTYFTDDQDLSPAATYAYTVTAFDGQNESAPAAPVVAVLLPAPRTTPTSTATAHPLGPLPTLAPIPPRTLTAIATLPRPVVTPLPAPGASVTPGIPPANTPVGGTVATSVPPVGSTPATSATGISGIATPSATAFALPTTAPVNTPLPIPTPAGAGAVPTSAPTRRP